MPRAERDPLYQKLLAFQIDDEPAVFAFGDRLAREQGWHPSHVTRVVLEYKRFLYLCATESVPMTPSHEVDQVWHLHLTYTRSYWERLCRDVLPGPLHHHPTQGGRRERAKFQHWYERTISAYRQAFGAEPPADIWPPVHLRFGADARAPHVDTRRCWVIPRPWAWPAEHRGLVIAAAALVAGTLLLLGCSRSVSNAITSLLLFFGCLAAWCFFLARGLGSGPGRPSARVPRRSRTAVSTRWRCHCPRHAYREVVDDAVRAVIEQRPCLCEDGGDGPEEGGEGGEGGGGDGGDGCGGGCGGGGD